MVGNAVRTVIVCASITIGLCVQACAAPAVPHAMPAQVGVSADLISFWGIPFPFGYAYRPGQCYKYVQEETPEGLTWRRVWICTEHGGQGYGEGGRF
jgi:hypothetical protein